jgi:hypothetical protein
MADIFSTMIGNLQSLGFFQFLFPFLLILAIAYGVLRKSLGEYLGKPASGLISIIIAFFVMNYSGNVGAQIATFFSTLFGTGLIVASGILVLVILLGLLGLNIRDVTHPEKKLPISTIAFAIAVIFIVFLMFVGAFGGTTGLPGLGAINLGSDFWTIIFFVLILVVVLWFLTREEEAKKE